MFLKSEKVIKEWTDYNGHMNVAYYVHIFDIASDVMLEKFIMGETAAKNDKNTGQQLGEIVLNKPTEVLFEGADVNIY